MPLGPGAAGVSVSVDWSRRHLALVDNVDPDRGLRDGGGGAGVVAVVLLRADAIHRQDCPHGGKESGFRGSTIVLKIILVNHLSY